MRNEIFIGSIVALGLAFLPMPYTYYLLLRVGMCGVFAYLTYNAWIAKDQNFAWFFGIAAVVYNPVAPLHLGREAWTVINLGTILLLFTARARTRKQDEL